MSIVRENLMTRAGYSPYCGNFDKCPTMPRATWTGEQFKCRCCNWLSAFPADFIAEYKAKWHTKAADDSPARDNSAFMEGDWAIDPRGRLIEV